MCVGGGGGGGGRAKFVHHGLKRREREEYEWESERQAKWSRLGEGGYVLWIKYRQRDMKGVGWVGGGGLRTPSQTVTF